MSLIQKQGKLRSQPLKTSLTIYLLKISLESFTDTEFNEMMKASRLILGTVEIGYIDPKTKTVLHHETGERRGLFPTFMSAKRRIQ